MIFAEAARFLLFTTQTIIIYERNPLFFNKLIESTNALYLTTCTVKTNHHWNEDSS